MPPTNPNVPRANVSSSGDGQNIYNQPDEETWNRITPELHRRLIITPEFLADLVARRVITPANKDTVQALNSHNPQSAKDYLLQIFGTRSGNQYQDIIQALEVTLQGGVLDILRHANSNRGVLGAPINVDSVIRRIKMKYGGAGPVEYSSESIPQTERYLLTEVYEDQPIKERWRHQHGFERGTYDNARTANILQVDSPGRSTTLLEGIPLIGKSAMLKMTRYRWAIGEQGTDIPLLIYIDHTHEAEDFKSTIDEALYFLDDEEKECVHWYRMTYPKRVMYVIDGIDHFRANRRCRNILNWFRQSRSHFVMSDRPNQPMLSGFLDHFHRILELQPFIPQQIRSFRRRYKNNVYPQSPDVTLRDDEYSSIPGVCKYECNYLYDPSTRDTNFFREITLHFLHDRENRLYLNQDQRSKYEAFDKVCKKAYRNDVVSEPWVLSKRIWNSAARVFLVRKVSSSGRVTFIWLTADLRRILAEMRRRMRNRNWFYGVTGTATVGTVVTAVALSTMTEYTMIGVVLMSGGVGVAILCAGGFLWWITS